MKRIYSILMILLVSAVLSAAYIEISAEINELGNDRWEYSYTLSNFDEALDVEWVTIWFDYQDYSNFEITTVASGSWNESIIQPEPLTQSGAGYNIDFTSSPIAYGESAGVFSIAFDYVGTAILEPIQFFEVVDPGNWQTLYTSQTVPEPTTLMLLGLGMLSVRFKRKSD